MQKDTSIAPFADDKVNQWFDQVISSLKTDQLMLETNTAPLHKQKMYETFLSGNEADIHKLSRTSSSLYFIKNLVNDFVTELAERQIKLTKLAFELSDAKILVWAEVKDDDEKSINDLILAEAKINANYLNYGFNIATTVVEETDNMPVPIHYKSAYPSH